ncbi:MAG: phage tail sheath family protein, partial [Candidatus Thorarchaeota archaeon]
KKEDAKENYIKAIESLERIDIFNLMVITKCEAMNNNDGIYRRILTRAVEFCEDQRAFLLIDPFYSWHPSDISQTQNIIENISEVRSIIPQHQCAVYYPFLMISESDPVTRDEFLREIGPAAAVAGVIARIDSQRGVWKAPAGIEAMLTGFERLSVNLTDDENGDLNVLGVNCIRAFISGITCWGARTVAGFDNSGTAWKYISTRRLTLFIEETLYRATRWVVFEPNDEPLWAKIRSSINPFMLDLYEKGAFQGTPDQAFFVKCDSETTTTEDQENGIVNIIVGFAPVKPAEFVIITIQRIMGKLS